MAVSTLARNRSASERREKACDRATRSVSSQRATQEAFRPPHPRQVRTPAGMDRRHLEHRRWMCATYKALSKKVTE